MWGSLLSAGVGLLGSMKGKKGKYNPGQMALEQLNNTPQHGYGAYNPFIQEGADINKRLRPEYEQMAYDPVDWLGNLESQYEETPGYKYKRNKLLKGARNAASAGGFAGTDTDVQNQSEMINGLLGTDMQRYLENVGSIHGKGLSGLETRTQRGYEASGNLADYLKSIDMARAGYAGQQASHAGQANSNVFNSLSGLINTGFKAMAGGRSGGLF